MNPVRTNRLLAPTVFILATCYLILATYQEGYAYPNDTGKVTVISGRFSQIGRKVGQGEGSGNF